MPEMDGLEATALIRECERMTGEHASNLSAFGVVEAARVLEMLGSSADRLTVEGHVARLVAEVDHLATAVRELKPVCRDADSGCR